jgi:hypothetical protein
MAGGIDPRAGRTLARRLVPVWLDVRKDTVSEKTHVAPFPQVGGGACLVELRGFEPLTF